MSSNRPRNPQTKGPAPAGKQPAGSVRVAPTRPQKGPPPAPQRGANNLPVMVIGGALVLLAIIVLGTAFLNNTPAPAATPVAGLAFGTATSGATGSTGGNANASGGATPAAGSGAPAAAPAAPSAGVAVVETTKGTFKIQLYSDPSVKGTVKNFMDKTTSGYFNGKTFHRVEDWVIQGGDPLGTGTGGGSMPGEYNAFPFKRGAVGMASTGAKGPTVNDSQWFVVKSDASYLDGSYSNFGQVVDGMAVVDQIAIGDKMTKITMQP